VFELNCTVRGPSIKNRKNIDPPSDFKIQVSDCKNQRKTRGFGFEKKQAETLDISKRYFEINTLEN